METIEEVLRLLEGRLAAVNEEILGGRLQSLEMYQALTHHRQLLNELIADIKGPPADETAADDDEPGPGNDT